MNLLDSLEDSLKDPPNLVFLTHQKRVLKTEMYILSIKEHYLSTLFVKLSQTEIFWERNIYFL